VKATITAAKAVKVEVAITAAADWREGYSRRQPADVKATHGGSRLT
jgi:hypothetical protein